MAKSNRFAPIVSLRYVLGVVCFVLCFYATLLIELQKTVAPAGSGSVTSLGELTNPMSQPGEYMTIVPFPATPTIENPPIAVGPDGELYVWISGKAARWIVIDPPTDCDRKPSQMPPSCWQGKI